MRIRVHYFQTTGGMFRTYRNLVAEAIDWLVERCKDDKRWEVMERAAQLMCEHFRAQPCRRGETVNTGGLNPPGGDPVRVRLSPPILSEEN